MSDFYVLKFIGGPNDGQLWPHDASVALQGGYAPDDEPDEIWHVGSPPQVLGDEYLYSYFQKGIFYYIWSGDEVA